MRRDLELRLAHDLAELEVAIEQEEYSLKLKTDAHQRFAVLQSRLAQCTEDALQTNFAPGNRQTPDGLFSDRWKVGCFAGKCGTG